MNYTLSCYKKLFSTCKKIKRETWFQPDNSYSNTKQKLFLEKRLKNKLKIYIYTHIYRKLFKCSLENCHNVLYFNEVNLN